MNMMNNLTKNDLMIIIDSNEKKPLEFKNANVIKKVLPFGDYTLLNFETDIIIERKELNDLINSLNNYHDDISKSRFFREIIALKGYKYKLILVEASLQDIYNHKYKSKINFHAIIGTIQSIMIKYNIPFIFSLNHDDSADFVEGYFYHFMKEQIKQVKRLNEFLKKEI